MNLSYSRILYYMTVIVFAAMLLTLIALIVLPIILNGFSPLAVVKGYSMLPTLREGDIVIVQRTTPEAIRPGDVIIYSTGGKLIIHRVIKVVIRDGEYYYVTKGDNNSLPDFMYFENNIGIPYNRVLGKVVSINGYIVKIPYLGYLALFLKGG
ncbi:signal peptidase I [Desulfurococcus amylolyticus]|uniref:Signal peptidase I n=1 Tax=Desulfurococcus amylolyticus DSM 16532 TaxID=768672 RepID=I3XPU9_DESAM|nr:signal peptidase I [Desulfurococcus amylolyticus]AFL65973.1 peptidase S26B, signal peptidase [Desulfurococcus amylolyticus DSM 16532]